MRAEIIQKLINEEFAGHQVFELTDESHRHAGRKGQESHFKLLLVSAKFEGDSRVQRQRKINALLTREFSQGLHALTMRLMTPQEWEKSSQNFESPDCQGGEKA